MSESKKVTYTIHESHLPLWTNNDWRYALIMGGRGNGRSGTASRYAVSQLLGKGYTRGAIMRAVREDIRASCWGDIQDRLTEQEITNQFRITDNDMFIERGQNSLRAHGFRASSGSLTARLKSLAGYNFVWIEEAEEIGEDEFRTLDDTLRTVKGRIRIILTLNTPAKNHWLIKKWFDLESSEVNGFYIPKLKKGLKDVIYIPGTWKENEPNLDLHTIERYKQYKEINPSYYYQMIEGLSPEVVMGRIYSGWKEIDEIPHEARLLGYGLDFGFSKDPDAIIAIYYHQGGYILDEKHYSTGNNHEQLVAICKTLTSAPIIADAADSRMIATLRQAGVNIIESDKGPGSVEYGIKHVQGLRISYTKTSANLKHEYDNYAWLVTKDGEEKNIPDPKCADHCFAGDTLVYTTKGKKRIDELVGQDGFLYSVGGKIKRFHSVRPTRTDAEVLTIHFSDSVSITITPDHLLLKPDGTWVEAQLLKPMDMIQSVMYERDTIFQRAKVYFAQQREILKQWLSAYAQICMGVLQWQNSQRFAYSSQGRQSAKQQNKKLGVENTSSSPIRTYDRGEATTSERACRENKTPHKEVAQIKRGQGVAQVTWEESNGKPKTFKERVFSLPYDIYNQTLRRINPILPPELQNERETKKVERITRGRAEVVFNLEVEGTHCLIANSVVAHNCLDALRYYLAKMITNNADPEYIEREQIRVELQTRKTVDKSSKRYGL